VLIVNAGKREVPM
jgi:hypothetical protein